MKRIGMVFILALLLLTSTLSAQVAIKAKRLYPVASPAISDGVLLLNDGKIEALGPAGSIEIPATYELYVAEVATPGLIDAHSVVGLSGILNQDHDQEQLENSSPIQPELRAIDAYNPRDPLVDYLRSFGITTIHTGHAPGNLIAGQTMVVKTRGRTVEEDTLVARAMVAATLGEGARESGKAPGTRAKAAAMLRSKLIEAQGYQKKLESSDNNEVSRDLSLEALMQVLDQEIPLLVTVNRAHDILTVLRIAEEFDLDMVLDHVAEFYLVLPQLQASEFPVIVHPPMKRAFGELENLSMDSAQDLAEAGILFAFQSSFEGYVPKTRVVLFEAAIAAGLGLDFERALRALTLDAARILGVSERIGSLEVGKDADVVLFDGDPFEYTTLVKGVFIDGELVSQGDEEWR